jgi:hypothetical protein
MAAISENGVSKTSWSRKAARSSGDSRCSASSNANDRSSASSVAVSADRPSSSNTGSGSHGPI